MKTEFIIRGYIAFSEKDNFENGCLPDTTKAVHVGSREWQAKAGTMRDLLMLLVDEFKGSTDGLILDSCDENGRVDLQVEQSRPFQVGRLSENTLNEWKAGKRDVWLTCYSFIVEKVESGLSICQEVGQVDQYGLQVTA